MEESKGIVFVYKDIQSAITKINNIAGQYEAAANKFKEDMIAATQNWSGASKNKFMHLIEQSEKSVYNHFCKSVPDIVKGMATLLSNNAEAMSTADTEVANSIPESL